MAEVFRNGKWVSEDSNTAEVFRNGKWEKPSRGDQLEGATDSILKTMGSKMGSPVDYATAPAQAILDTVVGVAGMGLGTLGAGTALATGEGSSVARDVGREIAGDMKFPDLSKDSRGNFIYKGMMLPFETLTKAIEMASQGYGNINAALNKLLGQSDEQAGRAGEHASAIMEIGQNAAMLGGNARVGGRPNPYPDPTRAQRASDWNWGQDRINERLQAEQAVEAQRQAAQQAAFAEGQARMAQGRVPVNIDSGVRENVPYNQTPEGMAAERLRWEEEAARERMQQSMADQVRPPEGLEIDRRPTLESTPEPQIPPMRPTEGALMDPGIEARRIADMQDNTRINEMRAERSSIDFPLRQEVLEQPKIKAATEAFIRQAEELRARGDAEGLTRLENEFAAGMRQLGIDSPQDAFGRGLFESGKGTKLPIENRGRVELPSEPGRSWTGVSSLEPLKIGNRFAKQVEGSLPIERNRGPLNKQAGMIDPDVIMSMFPRLSRTAVRSADGLPKRVYHGTSKDVPFKDIKPTRHGAWFTEHADEASSYAKDNDNQRYKWDSESRSMIQTNTASRVMPVYLDIQKPYKLTPADIDSIWNRGNYKKYQSELFDRVRREGYDGVEMGGGIWVAFKPEQIVSALSPKLDKQRGSVGDPEFMKFKDTLPEPMKKFASDIWKDRKERAAEPMVGNEAARKTMDRVPGLKDVTPIDPGKPEEIKARVLAEPDIGDGVIGKQLVAGGKLYGFGTGNTLVRYVVQQLDRGMRESEATVRRLIQDKDTGFRRAWEKLPDVSFSAVWSEMARNEGVKTLSREQMRDLGWSDAQIKAATLLRNALDETLKVINEARELIGKKPLTAREGYLPFRFRGDWVSYVRDSEGKLVHVIGTATRGSAKSVVEGMRQAHPELTFEDVKHEPIHRFSNGDAITTGYQAMLEVLSKDDPRVEALEATYKDLMDKRGYEATGFKRHFEFKTGVRGAEGFKEWKSDAANAKEGLRAVINYIKQGTEWAELQKSTREISTLLKDKEVQTAQRNAVDYSQKYMDQVMGRSTPLAKALDVVADYALAESTGIGMSAWHEALKIGKQGITGLYLGFGNVGFALSQLVQTIQMTPAWAAMMKHSDPNLSIMSGYVGGMMDAMGAFTHKGIMSETGKSAMEYAKKYGIVDSHFLDDVRSLNASRARKAWDVVSSISMTAPEKVARTGAYLTYVHMLETTGLKGKELFETAANLTDMSMTDYRLHERANIYKNLGMIGDMASSLTTFKHNQFSQLWALGKRGGVEPVAITLGMQLTLGGLMGLYGREEVDGVINILNKASPVRIPTLTELILTSADDLVAFGGVSAATGFDLSSKFSAANVFPDDPMQAVFPFAGTVARMGENLVDLAKHPNATQAMRTANEFTPSGLRGVVTEPYFNRNGMQLDPKSLEGRYFRTPKDQTARMLGVKSIPESRETQMNFQAKESNKWYADKRTSVVTDAVQEFNSAKGTDTERAQSLAPRLRELAQKYERYEGDSNNFVSEVLSKVENAHFSQAKRLLMDATTNPKQYKRMEGMYGKDRSHGK